MKKFLVLVCLSLLPACAHKIESAADLKVYEQYALIGNDEVKHCKLKIYNIGTAVALSEDMVMPLAAVGGTEAMVCGMIDCSTEEKKIPEFYQCAPIEILKDQSSKSK
jgi:hypothetical protein